MSRIVFFCIPAWGHTNPTVEVVRQLTDMGQQVRYYSFAPFREKLEAAGRVHKVHTEEGAFFQFCPHPEADHGCFLLRCEACGRMVHLDCGHLEDLCRHLEAQHHFRIDPRQTILTGRCRSCVEKESVHELQ